MANIVTWPKILLCGGVGHVPARQASKLDLAISQLSLFPIHMDDVNNFVLFSQNFTCQNRSSRNMYDVAKMYAITVYYGKGLFWHQLSYKSYLLE